MTAIEALKALLDRQEAGPQLIGDFGRGLDRGIVMGLEIAIGLLESGSFE